MSQAEGKKKGRPAGTTKATARKISKSIRFTEAEHGDMDMARGITGEDETGFIRDAIGTKIKRTLKKASHAN